MSRNSLQTLRFGLAALACMTWLLPWPAIAADQSQGNPHASRHVSLLRDVALGSGGRMTGQLVSAEGQPQANQVVIVQRPGVHAQQVRTDAKGRFSLEGVSGGVYQVATVDSSTLCRCWVENTAPPGATNDLLIVAGQGVQRGQRPIGELLFSGPVLVALVIAAAIAIPIAVHNSQDAS